jgi:hypothetical protein
MEVSSTLATALEGTLSPPQALSARAGTTARQAAVAALPGVRERSEGKEVHVIEGTWSG